MHKFAIILILAAILVPSMIGYVKKSKEVQARYEDTVIYEDYYENDEFGYSYE